MPHPPSQIATMPLRLFALILLLTATVAGGFGCGESDDSDTAGSDAATKLTDAAEDGTGTDAGGSDGSADASCSPWSAAGAPTTIGGARPAKVYLPTDWSHCHKPPLVVLLHGFTATGTLQNLYLGLSARVNKEGFALVIPEGTLNPDKNQFWNATNACCDFHGQGVDDVAYLRGLIKEATTKLGTDPARVALVGHSNGGFMALRMACESADLVSDVVSIAGAVTQTAASCKPTRAVNVLQIHGTKDATIKYDGGALYPSASETYERWVKLNGCGGKPPSQFPVDYDNAVDGKETYPLTRVNCNEGVRVMLWTMKGTGHIPGFNTKFKDMLAFHVAHAGRQAPK
ncbi:MAG: alpha/beta hydrolase fold domain-containing protein [Myxococcales bacterium]|nr:alpha/beta hydrolase fold domain-containing protein [Myxococcales bacterium]